MAFQEVLGISLGRFEDGTGLARPETFQTGVFKCVDHAGGEWCFRAVDGQAHLFALRKREQLRHIFSRDIDVAHTGFPCGAGVARRDQHLVDARRLCALPGQRVLATATTDDQDLHASSSWCALMRTLSGGNGVRR